MLKNRTLYFGDNLEILREKIPEESFDLIYLDPPFNSNRNYNVLFKEGLQDSPAQVQAFEDSWHWTREAQEVFEELAGGVRPPKTKINADTVNLMQAMEKLVKHNDMLAYLTMMTVRLIELRRVLKSTGSIYLHCDPTASHYLKLVMDAIFGKQNFRNEIIWCYRGAGYPQNDFGKRHDVILRYSKTDNYIFNLDAVREEYAEATKERFKHYIGNVRRGGDFGQQELHPLGRHPDDWWQIQPIAPSAKERLGYPTQKPEALLEKIIKASSKEGDWVLDPFCGCGTTVAVAERLKRNWVGIDIAMLAINLISHRLRDGLKVGRNEIFIDGIPSDLAGAKALAEKDRFEFEYWVLDLVNAIPAQSKTKENMRGADKGIDGVITIVKSVKSGKKELGKILVQVKSGGVHRDDIATLKSDVQREKAEGGVFVTLERPTQPMRTEAVEAGTFRVDYSQENLPKIQIMTVEELLNGKKLDLPPAVVLQEAYYKEAKPVKSEKKSKELGI